MPLEKLETTLKCLIQNSNKLPNTTFGILGTVSERILTWHVALMQSGSLVKSHRKLANIVMWEIANISNADHTGIDIDVVRQISYIIGNLTKMSELSPKMLVILPYVVTMSTDLDVKKELSIVVDYLEDRVHATMHAHDINLQIETAHYYFVKNSLWDFDEYICKAGDEKELSRVCIFWQSNLDSGCHCTLFS
jgi:hypothetical protein